MCGPALITLLLLTQVPGSDTPASSLFVEGLLVGTVQRTGALADVRLRYRHRLYDAEDIAFRDNSLGAGVITQVSPVFAHGGGYVELAPASFLRFSAGYQVVGYYGVLGSLRALSDCDAAPSLGSTDSRCDFRPAEDGQPLATFADQGHRLWVDTLVQGKLGPVLFYDCFSAERWWFRERWAAGEDYGFWFNELLALPQRRDDTVLTNSAALLLELVPEHILLDASGDLAYASGTGYLTQRVGVTGILRVPAWRGLRELAAALIVQLYTNDRYTVGPMPFLGLALGASTGSLL